MSSSEGVRPLLAARAATDPDAARLLEMFTKADEILSERCESRSGMSECPGKNSGEDGTFPATENRGKRHVGPRTIRLS